jgi:hypothetical protein
MLIPVSIRSVRTAVAKAQAALKQKFEEDKAELTKRAFNQLHDGAVHNGLNPSPAEVKVMHEMVDRDVDHAMEQHESTGLLGHLAVMAEMVEYFETHDEDADGVVIDSAEFRLLKDYLNGDVKKG